MRLVIAAIVAASLLPVVSVPEASAQATCRQKCTDEENACLKRTNNKGQCGDKAKACAAKCK